MPPAARRLVVLNWDDVLQVPPAWLRSAGSGPRLHQGKFRLETGENFFSKRAVMCWHREVLVSLVSPSLQVFR